MVAKANMETKHEAGHTILVDKYRQAAAKPGSSSGYHGLTIHALAGLHEYLTLRVREYFKLDSRLLDLAAGTGAMSLRLNDLGYKVTATDYVFENFRLHDTIPFFVADLNDCFAKDRENQFEGIVASEIIEHLENPRNFARECFKLLKPGGKIILSTPNVDSVASIVSFMRSGTFQWFGDSEYERDGHITPMTQWQIEKCFREAGFSFLWKGSFGDREGKLKGSPRLLLLCRLIAKFTVCQKDLNKQIFVAVLEKPARLG
jgi:2-polyprenyl-3-methyl-5-hydroxy-6-metoxy-1,4-benzoquinol methylase